MGQALVQDGLVKAVKTMQGLKIKELEVEEIGCFKHLLIEPAPGVNLICGGNGTGKSTLLKCIASGFINSAQYLTLKKRQGSRQGLVRLKCDAGRDTAAPGGAQPEAVEVKYQVNNFSPVEREQISTGLARWARYAMQLGVNRLPSYIQIDSLKKDSEVSDYDAAQEMLTGLDLQGGKEWFIRRFLFADKEGSLSSTQLHNFALAREVFGLLDEHISFERVAGDSYDIILKTQDGSVCLEYLSDGYKAAVFMNSM